MKTFLQLQKGLTSSKMGQNRRKKVEFHGFGLKTKIRPGHRVVLTKIHIFFGFSGYSCTNEDFQTVAFRNFGLCTVGQNSLFCPKSPKQPKLYAESFLVVTKAWILLLNVMTRQFAEISRQKTFFFHRKVPKYSKNPYHIKYLLLQSFIE